MAPTTTGDEVRGVGVERNGEESARACGVGDMSVYPV
jgi:hypothetical protein